MERLVGPENEAGVQVADGFVEDVADAVAGVPPVAGVESVVRVGNDADLDLGAAGFFVKEPGPPRMDAVGKNIDAAIGCVR